MTRLPDALTEVHLSSLAYTFGHWMPRQDHERLDLTAPYQRGSVWTVEQRRALVRSLIQGVPIGARGPHRRRRLDGGPHGRDGRRHLMPIEVRIDVTPHGDETARHQIGKVRIVQTEKLDDDPDGWRVYAVTGARMSTVRHRRGDGAGRLVALALAADQQLTPPAASVTVDNGTTVHVYPALDAPEVPT